MKITAHTLVKNEELYLWFAVMSVIEHVDMILLWDTGSTDNTVEIIKEIKKLYPNKVNFREVGEVDINEFTKVRQKMLDETNSDWFIIVDGDEVWWEDSIKDLVKIVEKNGNVLDSIVTPYKNVIGDIYHYQDETAGNYEIDGKRGHHTIRAINRKIQGLHLDKPHGTQGFFDKNGVLIQERDKERRMHMNKEYLHFTHMQRSGREASDVPKRSQKYKYEIGKEFSLDFYYPEVFFLPRIDIIKSPWRTMSESYRKIALLQTPLRKIKRMFGYTKNIGY